MQSDSWEESPKGISRGSSSIQIGIIQGKFIYKGTDTVDVGRG